MKFRLAKLIIFSSICLIIIICIFGGNKRKETIKIGITGTMSGINSDLSVSGRRGVELAVNEINKNKGIKGRKVELVIKDDSNNPNISRKIYEEFINENIKLVIGPYTSGMIVNSIDYLKNKDILLLSPTANAEVLSFTDDNFIRFIPSIKEQAVVLANIADKNNNKNFAVIYNTENKGFNEVLYNNFKKLLEKDNGRVILTKTFTSKDYENYSNLAKEVAQSKADALFIIANSMDNAAITQQVRKVGCKVQIYSPLWSNCSELIKKGGTAVEGMLVVGGIDINNKSMNFTKFKNDYRDKYGENPTSSSMYSYETAMALFEAMEMGPNFTPSTIKKNILKIKNFKGLESNYQIDEFGDSTRKYMIFKIENGQLRKVD